MAPFATLPATLDRDAFVARFGGVYELSPWIAERAFDAGLTAEANSIEGLSGLLRAQVEAGGADRQLALLRAHPDLAGKLAVADELTAASAAEQEGAGLAACTTVEFERFQSLNAAYKERFGFPFIVAVAGYHRTEIFEIFVSRFGNDRDTEFREALEQVHRIALLRLQTALSSTDAPGVAKVEPT
jgi:OHCU decarboxylase